MNNLNSDTFSTLYKRQEVFQHILLLNGVYGDKNEQITPCDDSDLFSYHTLHLMCEIGELLKSDTRWKAGNGKHIYYKNKEEELADCFIELMNVAIFSGYEFSELLEMIKEKQSNNFKKLKG